MKIKFKNNLRFICLDAISKEILSKSEYIKYRKMLESKYNRD